MSFDCREVKDMGLWRVRLYYCIIRMVWQVYWTGWCLHGYVGLIWALIGVLVQCNIFELDCFPGLADVAMVKGLVDTM